MDDTSIKKLKTIPDNNPYTRAIIQYLEERPLPINTNRKNTGVGRSQSLGMIHNRMGTYGISAFTKKRPELYELCRQLGKRYIPKFKYTSIQINQNYKAKEHLDGNNVGLSAIIGIGDYSGGGLYIKDKLYDIHNKFISFNGALLRHATQSFKGNRITLVYFNHGDQKSNAKTKVEGSKN